MNFLKSIINWIVPEKCIICSKEVDSSSIFCFDCFSNGIVFIDFPYCKHCGKLLDTSFNEEMLCETCSNKDIDRYFDIGRSLFLYSNNSRNIIMRIKKHAEENIAKICAKLIYSRYKNIINEYDLIIPVPSHISRILKRGFNPATIIAKHISNASKIPLDIKILKRIKKTDYQKNKPKNERQQNVCDAFKVFKDISGKKILLVDDVLTTGATISECAKTLKKHGAINVGFITISSTP